MRIWRPLLVKMSGDNLSGIAERLKQVQDSVTKAWEKACETNPSQPKPELVAVSKLQPVESIVEAYQAGHRHFGENYIQELLEKVNSPLIKEQCPDIKWHFIGNIQKNKASKLFTFPIHLIQSVDSIKLLDYMAGILKRSETPTPVKILLQVNTSGEETKGGVQPETVCDCVKHIKDACEPLQFHGLMTIGEANVDPSQPNMDFQTLVKLRAELDQRSLSPLGETQLSMGMSSDYDEAILMGSTIVRVGTAIFGARPSKTKP